MKCTYIKLVGFKRMTMLRGDYFEKYFDSHVTIVKGRNGSGKSSLYGQLLPYPANKNDFLIGGLEIKKYEHKGVEYELISDFTNNSPKYSFIVNGENLNRAHLLSAQKTLCEEHFLMNKTIHSILVGSQTLTNLSLGTRKNILSLMTKVNIDNLLKNYSDLNTQTNLYKMMLKTETQQFKIEENKLLDEVERENLNNELSEVRARLGMIVEIRNHLSRYFNPEDSEESLVDLNSKMLEYKELLTNNYNYVTSYPEDSINEWKEKYLTDLTNLKNKIDHIFTRLEDIAELKVSLGDVGGESGDGLNSSLLGLRDKEIKLVNDISFVPITLDRETMVADFVDIYRSIDDNIDLLLPNLNDQGGYIYTTPRLHTLKNKVVELGKERMEQSSIIATIEANKKQLGSIDRHVNCPSCKVSLALSEFFSGDHNVQEEIDAAVNRITEIDKEVEDLRTTIDVFETYFNAYRAIANVKERTKETFNVFWKQVDSSNLLIANPQGIKHLVTGLVTDMDKYKELIQVREDITRVKDKMSLASKLGNVTLESLRAEESSLQTEYEYLLDDRETLERQLLDVRHAETIHTQLNIIDGVIERCKDRVRSFNLSTVVSEVFTNLDVEITNLRLEEVTLTKRFNENSMVENSIRICKEKINEIEDNLFINDLALAKLSPKNGIIAETISAFLNTIIENMNTTIERVWTYPLRLLPIDVEKGSLDYSFAVEVNEQTVVDDVGSLSDGQKEVVNLSFKLIIYLLLGLHDYPLFFDELARSLDEDHTANMMKMIDNFTNDSSFSQIFIVNHKEKTNFIQDADIINLSEV